MRNIQFFSEMMPNGKHIGNIIFIFKFKLWSSITTKYISGKFYILTDRRCLIILPGKFFQPVLLNLKKRLINFPKSLNFSSNSSKLKALFDHFKGVTDNFINNVNQLIKETGNKPINVKPLMRCYGIDVISKFVFSLDVDSYKDKEYVKGWFFFWMVIIIY